jgi:putative ABC transport system permease protein
LLESLLLSLAGGALGFVLSSAGLRLMARVTTDAGFPYFVRFTMDARVVAFFAVVCVGTSVLFGLAPALHVSRPSVDRALRDSSRTTTAGVPARRFSSAMVVSEIALAMVLLTGAGLLIRSFVALYTLDLGMNTAPLLTMRVDLPTPKYPNALGRIAFYRQLLERLTATPGVDAATIASSLPLGEGQASRGLAIEGRASAAGEPLPIVMVVTVGSSYFQTCDVDIRRGRPFRETDGAPGADNVIVNERLVARLFQDRDPIGERIQLRTGPEGTTHRQTIVGVSRTVRQNGAFGTEPDAVVYVPYRQDPAPAMTLIVRSRTPPVRLIPTLREHVRALDPNLPVFNIATMDQALAEARRFPGFFASLFSIFALVALGLSAVGLYAITAYVVAQRTQEIGLRMALGSTSRQVRWLILRRTLAQLAVGLTIGIGGSLALSRLLILAQVSAADPVTFVSVALLFAAVSIVAALAGANPATRLDPVVALRFE